MATLKLTETILKCNLGVFQKKEIQTSHYVHVDVAQETQKYHQISPKQNEKLIVGKLI